MAYYAVVNGRTNGIFLNWDDCKTSIIGHKGAIYKKFKVKADAERYIQSNGVITASKIENNTIDFIPDYYVYTDGSCYNNGKQNALAGIGIYFGIDDIRNTAVKVNGKQTNNTAELSSIIETYHIIEEDILNGKKIVIVSDSKYALRCISSYGEKCNNAGWDLDIPNKELVKTAYEMYKCINNVHFLHIKAHTNNTDVHSIGNYNADKLANKAICLDK
jgi:ribonuclease HI